MRAKLPTPKSHKRRPHAAQRRSPVQERELADKIGGEVIKGSGCGPVRGDVRLRGVVRIEAKTTSAASFRVTREMVRKIEEAGAAAGEVPVICVEFVDRNGNPLDAVYVVPSWALDLLIGRVA